MSKLEVKKSNVSAIVITLNEESNIDRCLQSLDWVDEVIVYDTGSQDQTLARAQHYHNVKIITGTWEGFARTKQRALEQTRHQWALWIDADEAVTELLKTEIRKNIDVHPETSAKIVYSFPRKNIVFGRTIAHGGWWPDRSIRLFPKRLAHFGDAHLHESLQFYEKVSVKHLNGALEHTSYTSLEQYFSKMIFYGKLGAWELKRKNKKKNLLAKMLFYPPYMFFRAYILKAGFLDGPLGLLLAMGTGVSVFMRYSYAYLIEKGIETPHDPN